LTNSEKIIRKKPIFELYVEENHLIVTNADNIKDNCVINLNTISGLELIRSVSFFDKIIEIAIGKSGISKPSKARAIHSFKK
jgi:hypothetical protein